MAIRFFHSTSYALHQHAIESDASEIVSDAQQPIGVRAYVDTHREIAFSADFDIASIVKARKDLAYSVEFYGDKLNKLDPASFVYLSESLRQTCEEELLFTFYNFSAQYQLHLFEGDQYNAKQCVTQLQRCANLLNTLRNTPKLSETRSPEQTLTSCIDDSADKPAAFVALRIIAPAIAENMLGMSAGEHLDILKQTMSDANFYRLNWVWGGGLDRLLLDLMPSHSHHAKAILSDIAPVTGYMSWVLYYFRLGIELYFLTTYTLKGSMLDPNASEADKAASAEIGLLQRFQTQWDLRKFAILNDAIWATANMVCFFWLVGNGMLGYIGNALTGLLLIFDVMQVAWGYMEEKTEHERRCLNYQRDIEIIQQKINDESDDAQKKILQMHYEALLEELEKHTMEWNHAERQWIHDMCYVVGLFATFSMLCCFFLPPAAMLSATALILGLVGSALSFLITIGSHALMMNTNIEALQIAMQKKEEKITILREKMDALASDDGVEAVAERARLALEITRRVDEVAKQAEKIDYYKKYIIQQTLSEALLPATAFIILVFVPHPYTLMVLIPIVAILLLSKHLLGLKEPAELEPPFVSSTHTPLNA